MTRKQLNVERSTSTAHRLLHYDGVCGNVHGHNFEWDVTAVVDMSETGDDNMAVDLKDIAGLIDSVDHKTLLNKDDPLVPDRDEDESGAYHLDDTPLGPMWIFNGDPTCEVVADWMAQQILNLEPVDYVEVTVNETAKYGISATAGNPTALDDV